MKQLTSFLPILGIFCLLLLSCVMNERDDWPQEIIYGDEWNEQKALLVRISGDVKATPVLLIHGAGNDASIWEQALFPAAQFPAFDWSDLSANRLTAPARGYSLGVDLGAVLLESWGDDAPEQFLLIAHSAGAWVAQGIADSWAEHAEQAPVVTIHFLDPFTALSIFRPFAGSRKLGRHAAFAETWYSTIDPVPFTRGAVAVGPVHNVNELIQTDIESVDAHWDVLRIYAESRPWM